MGLIFSIFKSSCSNHKHIVNDKILNDNLNSIFDDSYIYNVDLSENIINDFHDINLEYYECNNDNTQDVVLHGSSDIELLEIDNCNYDEKKSDNHKSDDKESGRREIDALEIEKQENGTSEIEKQKSGTPEIENQENGNKKNAKNKKKEKTENKKNFKIILNDIKKLRKDLHEFGID
jgi:hypothetical protein